MQFPRITLPLFVFCFTTKLSTGALDIWPAPREFSTGSELLALSEGFTFVTKNETSTMKHAFERYTALIRSRRCAADLKGTLLLKSLSVVVESDSESVPQHGTDESYHLVIGLNPMATLTAKTVYGALRGLESFSQLVQFNASTSMHYIDKAHAVCTSLKPF